MKIDGHEKSKAPKARGEHCREGKREEKWQWRQESRRPVLRKRKHKTGAK